MTVTAIAHINNAIRELQCASTMCAARKARWRLATNSDLRRPCVVTDDPAGLKDYEIEGAAMRGDIRKYFMGIVPCNTTDYPYLAEDSFDSAPLCFRFAYVRNIETNYSEPLSTAPEAPEITTRWRHATNADIGAPCVGVDVTTPTDALLDATEGDYERAYFMGLVPIPEVKYRYLQGETLTGVPAAYLHSFVRKSTPAEAKKGEWRLATDADLGKPCKVTNNAGAAPAHANSNNYGYQLAYLVGVLPESATTFCYATSSHTGLAARTTKPVCWRYAFVQD
jgi:hypothetical protein